MELIDESLYIAEQEECILSRNVPLGSALICIMSEQFPIRSREIRHDVWHRRAYGVGTIPWMPSKRVSTRSDNMPRADLGRLTKRLRRPAKRAQK